MEQVKHINWELRKLSSKTAGVNPRTNSIYIKPLPPCQNNRQLLSGISRGREDSSRSWMGVGSLLGRQSNTLAPSPPRLIIPRQRTEGLVPEKRTPSHTEGNKEQSQHSLPGFWNPRLLPYSSSECEGRPSSSRQATVKVFSGNQSSALGKSQSC